MAQKLWEFSKDQVHYKAAPSDKVRCDVCRYMFPKAALGSCKIVRGTIKGSYTCDEFAPATRT